MRDQHALHLTRRQLAQAYSRRRSCNASEASCGRGCGISCEIADVKLSTYTGLSGTSVWQGNIDQLTPGIAYEVNVAEALSFSATGHLVPSVHKCHGRRQGAGWRGAWARPIRLAYYTPPGPPVMWVGGARLGVRVGEGGRGWVPDMYSVSPLSRQWAESIRCKQGIRFVFDAECRRCWAGVSADA